MRRRFSGPMAQGLALFGVALLLALFGVSWQALMSSSRFLFPELAQKALAEADQAKRKIDAALDLGIPAERLVGVDALFAAMKASDPDVAFLAVTDGSTVLFLEGRGRGDFDRALAAEARTPGPDGLAVGQSLRGGFLVTALPLGAGQLYLGHDEGSLLKPLLDNLFDVGVIVMVALLLAFEVMLLVVSVNVVQPARAATAVLRGLVAGRTGLTTGKRVGGVLGAVQERLDALAVRCAGSVRTAATADAVSLIGVRLLAFLFVFAEELGRPFLPVYAGEFAARTPGLDANLATGVVVGLHMSVVALAMPFATVLYSRLGRTRLYALGALTASAGLIGTGLASGYWDLLLWRALSAIGYATTFVACQGFVIETTTSANRASGTAMMVGGITLADICGPAFGGVMAERFGQGQTFLLGAGVAVLASLLVVRLMAGRRPLQAEEAPRQVTLRDFVAAFANRRLVLQLCLAAVPAKVLLTGFLFYLLPVTLLGFGWREADVGRIVMVYGITMLFGGPLFGRLTDRRQNHAAVVACGGLLSGLPLLAVPLVPVQAVLPVALLTVLALGAGQSMSITAQASMVVGMARESDVRRGHAPELTVLRFVERFGGGLGPMVAAPLAAAIGSVQAIGVLGIYAAASAILYALVAARGRPTEASR
jgi:predicted MFS family arabinose efflux permease